MTTHRSLNKLEFKAHMSIHNKVEVPEEEMQGSHYTRDRFGKKQRVQVSPKERRSGGKKLAPVIIVACLLTGLSQAEAARNTDVQVESSALGVLLDRQVNKPEERFGIPLDESKEIGLNENGDPNLNVRF